MRSKIVDRGLFWVIEVGAVRASLESTKPVAVERRAGGNDLDRDVSSEPRPARDSPIPPRRRRQDL
jgi:hypothetical protein